MTIIFQCIVIFGFMAVFSCAWTIIKQLDRVIGTLESIQTLMRENERLRQQQVRGRIED